MNITQFNSKEELDQHAAELFAALLAHNPQATLGLATGSTPTGIYEKMIKMHQAGRLSFNEAATFNLDEYVGLPPGHDQSYAYYMNKYLFNHVDVRREHIHLLDGMADDLAAECSRYDQLLAAKPIDIQLLGLGHNGHIGFNEPDHSLQGGTHIVELKAETREANARFFESVDQVPAKAVTMGIGSILKADTILLVVKGADKAEIVKEALTGPITTECPASLLQTHAKVIVLLDREAGRLLD